MTVKEKRVVRRAKEWQRHIEALEQSGLTMTAYARQQGLNVKSFGNARKRLARRANASESAPTALFRRVNLPLPATPWAYRIQLPQGVVIEVAQGIEVAPLAPLLATVGNPR